MTDTNNQNQNTRPERIDVNETIERIKSTLARLRTEATTAGLADLEKSLNEAETAAMLEEAGADPLMPRNIDYDPQLADWESCEDKQFKNVHWFYDSAGTHGIHDEDNMIFTIRVNEKINPDAARAIANHIQYAPEIWRKLRDIARYMLCSDIEQQKEFGEIAVLLSAASPNPAFAPPEPEPDETIHTERMERDRLLANPAWRKAMISEHIRIIHNPAGPVFECVECHQRCTSPRYMALHLTTKHGIELAGINPLA